MGKSKPLKVRLIWIHDGVTEQIERLPQEALDIMSERLSRTMSDYYTQHPDEFRRLCEADSQ